MVQLSQDERRNVEFVRDEIGAAAASCLFMTQYR
jgi:hypothetical protein